MAPTAIGVDIGGTHLRAARVAADGSILARARMKSAADPEAVLAGIMALITEVTAPDVAAIGIGVPGAVDFPARKVLWGGYVNLSGIALADRIESAFSLLVVIDNDCTMALIAEAAIGAARGASSALMLTIGTGIGGAILEQGRVVRGRATAGQLGHVTIDPLGEPCVCGRIGCVETTSSGTALGRHIARAGLPAGTTADQLLAARATGDAAATAILAAWAAPLRTATNTLGVAFDPQIIILGGGLGGAAVAALAEIPQSPAWFTTTIAAATLGDDAGIIGAAFAALNAAPKPKRAVLVNGIPASGKSAVALALSRATGWPVLALDTIKNPFLHHLGGADRVGNRTLGRASYQAIFATLRDAPPGTTTIIDAWFGFEPLEVLETHLATAGITETAEIWCHAPAEILAERYGSRLGARLPGHPGADYIPELMALAARATPIGRGPLRDVDTTKPTDTAVLVEWLTRLWGRSQDSKTPGLPAQNRAFSV